MVDFHNRHILWKSLESAGGDDQRFLIQERFIDGCNTLYQHKGAYHTLEMCLVVLSTIVFLIANQLPSVL